MRFRVFSMFKSVVVSAAAVSLAIAGCSTGGGGDASSSATPELSETSTTTALPPLEYEDPPQYPDNMEVDSSENAVRFVEFAIETLNYAQRFNDVEAIQAISVPECQFCNGLVETFGSLRDRGHRTIGGEISCTYIDGVYQGESGLFFLFTDCVAAEATIYDAAGEVIQSVEASEYPMTWMVTMINETWLLGNAGITSEGDRP